MKILVIGKNGQLGKSIHKIIKSTKQINKFIFIGRDKLDFNNTQSIQYFFKNKKFDILINCAAYTAVDQAEKESDLANKINNIAVRELAKIANKQNTKLIHISTDYVFDGQKNKPYLETDLPNPINVYGKTKCAGENSLKKAMLFNAIIIRTSWVYSEFGKNFLKSIIKLGKKKGELEIVSDQIGSPTYATDLASVILEIIKSKTFIKNKFPTEIYHYSNSGSTNWFKFAKEIFRLININCNIKPILSKNYFSSAKRPKNSTMSSFKIINKYKVKHKSWKSSLKKCIISGGYIV